MTKQATVINNSTKYIILKILSIAIQELLMKNI